MGRHLIQRIGAWLCLASALFMGLAPAQTLVLCFGPGGTIAVEVSPAGTPCGGCPEVGRASDRTVRVSADLGGANACPCVDIPVGSQERQPKLKPRSVELDGPAPLTALPAFTCSLDLDVGRASARSAQLEPRVASALVLIRSVVLLV